MLQYLPPIKGITNNQNLNISEERLSTLGIHNAWDIVFESPGETSMTGDD